MKHVGRKHNDLCIDGKWYELEAEDWQEPIIARLRNLSTIYKGIKMKKDWPYDDYKRNYKVSK
jgi:hypothetical protein